MKTLNIRNTLYKNKSLRPNDKSNITSHIDYIHAVNLSVIISLHDLIFCNVISDIWSIEILIKNVTLRYF